MNDPASLQNLNDIVLPADVAWWPPGPGWFVLAAVIVAVSLALTYRRWRRWQRDRYRREALHELSAIAKQDSALALQDLPVLLKRAALSAWPRRDVASLSGQDWHRFLDHSAALDRFCSGSGDLLDRAAYHGAEESALADPGKRKELLDASGAWLKRHRVPRKGD